MQAGAGAYGIALLMAGIGAGLAYAIVHMLGAQNTEAVAAGDSFTYGHYDPTNPYSPPRGGETPPRAP